MRPRDLILLTMLSCAAPAWTQCPGATRLVAATPTTPAPPAPPAPPATPSTPAPATPPAPTGEAIACKVDADCPVLACGPCSPGLRITKELADGPDCDRNPCEGSASACTDKVCVIHPGTHKDPAVWGSTATQP